MAAIDAGPRRQRGILGLLCGTISIRKNILCIGDNSIAESAETTDRCGMPDNQQQPDIEIPYPSVCDPAAVTIPSPVLVSKKLAEEAVAKRRNVRFKNHATVIEEEEEIDSERFPTAETNQERLLESTNTTTTEKKCNRRTRQKKMAPAPPLPGIVDNASY
ncbi:hypothetical protein GHT06_009341 [Daphnia sinensis]|uniref:Uncharacterized protein n=1 Tax=Daphnia sinensis TaxID=1820382 RepID=A0AAD5L2U3_9CRUS|nr:hypothetical protein GHT06_009341 [Daphnia sinensis]